MEFSKSGLGQIWIKISSILLMRRELSQSVPRRVAVRPRSRVRRQPTTQANSSLYQALSNAIQTLDNQHTLMLLSSLEDLSQELLCLRTRLAHQLSQHQFCMPFALKALQGLPHCLFCVNVYMSHCHDIPACELPLPDEMVSLFEEGASELAPWIERLPLLTPNCGLYAGLAAGVREGGGEMGKIAIVEVRSGRRIIALSKIQKNQQILFVPKAGLITLQLARTLPLVQRLVEGRVLLRSPKHTQLAIFLLLHGEMGPASPFAAYLQTLPRQFSHFPVNYSEELLGQLKGSSFLEQVEQKRADMRRDYEAVVGVEEGFGRFGYVRFVEARLLVSSRVFGIVVEQVKTDALVPVADMLNHRLPKQTSWYYCGAREGFVIQSLREIGGGCEVFDSYGQKCNSRFLLNYGFLLPNNSHNEAIDIDLSGLLRGLPRSIRIRLSKFLDSKGFEEMLGLLRATVEAGSGGEESEEEIAMGLEGLKQTAFIGVENEVMVWRRVEQLVAQRLREYPQSMAEDKTILQGAQDYNFCNVVMLRRGEKEVLTFYQTMSRRVVRYLESGGRRGDVSAYHHYIDTINPFASQSP